MKWWLSKLLGYEEAFISSQGRVLQIEKWEVQLAQS